MATTDPKTLLQIPSCAAFNLRKASRTVTQMYDDALRPVGLRSTQFTLLFVIQRSQPIAVKQLAQRVVMDRTTLTRNLEPLKRSGLVVVEPGSDRRIREVSISDKGTDLLVQALPLWQRVQGELVESMGEGKMHELLGALRHTVSTFRS